MNISTTIQKSALPDIEKWKKIFADRLKKCRTVKDKNGNTVKTRSGKEKMYSVESVVDHTQGYVSPTNYRHWENCDLSAHLPHGECLADIANTYHVSVDYLLGLSDFRTPENNYIAKEIGLTDGAIDKLRQMKQADQTTALQIISDILTAPDFDKIIACFLDLYTNALQQKDMNMLKTTVSEKEMSALVKSLDTSDIIEKSEKYRMIEWYLNEYKTKAAALVNNGQFLKATYADISRLSWNLAESYYQSKAGE